MDRFVLVLAIFGLTPLVACTHSQPEAAEAGPNKDTKAEPAQAEPEPAQAKPEAEAEAEPAQAEPEAEPGDVATRELTVVPSEMSLNEDGKTMEYCLDCKRMASRYTYCDFDKDAFAAAIGDAPSDQPLNLRVKMVPKSTQTGIEGDPNGARPHGGFTHERYACSVEAVLPAAE